MESHIMEAHGGSALSMYSRSSPKSEKAGSSRLAGTLSNADFTIEKVPGLTAMYRIKDGKGGLAYDVQIDFVGRTLTLRTAEGKVAGRTYMKFLAALPEFELYQGDKPDEKLIGFAKGGLLGGMSNFSLSDAQRNPIAEAKRRSLLKMPMEFDVTAGKEAVALIRIERGKVGVVSLLTTSFIGYSIAIMKKGVIPTIMLLELVLCMEYLISGSGKGHL